MHESPSKGSGTMHYLWKNIIATILMSGIPLLLYMGMLFDVSIIPWQSAFISVFAWGYLMTQICR